MLLDYSDILKTIKQASLETLQNTSPTDVLFGVVESVEPLAIRIDQKIVLSKAQLKLTKNVTDFTINITVNHKTEKDEYLHTHDVFDTFTGGGSASTDTYIHTHEVVGTKEITFHNKLNVGDSVILIKALGGQLYIVLDKVG